MRDGRPRGGCHGKQEQLQRADRHPACFPIEQCNIRTCGEADRRAKFEQETPPVFQADHANLQLMDMPGVEAVRGERPARVVQFRSGLRAEKMQTNTMMIA
ncbi:hypothetical protein NSE01_31420 [Novosphingobium sediminis]|uniref:Uncharacterized protein n=1 Tax=Novosphingobium sediminis TaxID=707214 RepID=A0A512ANM8_9SPHN|nr:hypothetical protein NSE01_31420 [Novosphingobium sediminis]